MKAYITKKGGHYSAAGLEAVATTLPTILGDMWNVRVVPAKSEDNTFDPPVAYVEATLFNLTLCFCADAEVYFNGGVASASWESRVQMPSDPVEVCKHLLNCLRDRNRTYIRDV